MSRGRTSISDYHSKLSIRADRQIEFQALYRSVRVQFPPPTLSFLSWG